MTSGERLKLFREKTGYNQTQFANFLNVPPRNWSRYEANLTNPPREVLIELAKMGLDLHWHLTGEGEMIKENNRVKNNPFDHTFAPVEKVIFHPKKGLRSDPSGGTIEAGPEEGSPPGSADDAAGERDMTAVEERTETVSEAVKRRLPVIVEGGEKGILIPVIGQGLSAGLGFDYDEGEVVRFIKIPAWIARKSPDLVALPIYGDSMEPTMGRGDLAVCDGGGFKDDGIYVLRDEDRGLMFCKRVVWAPGGWTIMSDNPRYEPMKVDDRALQIVAWVIAAIQRGEVNGGYDEEISISISVMRGFRRVFREGEF
jgi:phage repressor protein C with HTH and peptisase S24 domain/DNA-binding XRE family transcriptional regulator